MTPQRTKSKGRCPFAGKCGGCSSVNTPYSEQIAVKQQRIGELIGAFGPVEPIVGMKNPDRYRNKVTAVFGLDRKGKPVCGVYRAHSHEIVPVRNCLIENRRADAIVQTIYGMLQSFKLRVYDSVSGFGILKAVQIRTSASTGQIMVTLVTAGPVFPSSRNFTAALLEKHPEITTVVQNINEKDTTMILGNREKILYGPGYIEDNLCGCRFRLSSRAFYQVNSIQAEKLYNIAIDAAGFSGKEKVLDAYCGTGTIGIAASGHCKEVIGVELNRDAVRDAGMNLKENGITNEEIFCADAGEFMEDLAERKEKIDVLLMDPPRSGASEQFLAAAVRLAPARIVYVSCGPESLKENLQYLTANGYYMKKAVPVDLFPHTDGIETVALLQKSVYNHQ